MNFSINKILKKKNSYTELPSIERREQSYRKGKLLQIRRDNSTNKNSDNRNPDLFILKDTFVKIGNIKKGKLRRDNRQSSNGTTISNKLLRMSMQKKTNKVELPSQALGSFKRSPERKLGVKLTAQY
mmetsp:Transcript_17332/g.17005  ORF Transcript_17332/g.17005 Transcript_17332/m.17005 type:complete len:127 (-) Transcript_17332:43-423(-)